MAVFSEEQTGQIPVVVKERASMRIILDMTVEHRNGNRVGKVISPIECDEVPAKF